MKIPLTSLLPELKNKTRILFRADGNSQTGLGHVTRCLALAEILSPDFSCTFAIQAPFPAIAAQIKAICEEVVFLDKTESVLLLEEAESIAANLTGQEIIVLDGYLFPTEYQQVLKRKGSMLVCLDDLHDRLFLADALINISGGVQKTAYNFAPYTKIYLGPTYAPLRKPFRELQKTVPFIPEKVEQILICFGGADPENFTLKYVQKLTDSAPESRLAIVTGSAYRHGQQLQQFISGKHKVTIHQNLNAEQMARLMQECSAAITSASSVAYEYCALNGMLFVEKTAANQNDLYRYLISEGLALPTEMLDQVLRSSDQKTMAQNMVSKQRNIFNGQAETNILNLFSELALQLKLTFRKFSEDDAHILFEWANDPLVRLYSFNSAPIPWETHLKWVRSKLADPTALLLLAKIDDQPASFIRFDLEQQNALISYQIAADFRGKGLGHRVLTQGLKELKKHFPEVKEAIGFVQPQNVASVRAFEKAEFENLGIEEESKAFKFRKSI